MIVGGREGKTVPLVLTLWLALGCNKGLRGSSFSTHILLDEETGTQRPQRSDLPSIMQEEMGNWNLNQCPREAEIVGAGRADSCTSLPPVRLGSATRLDSVRVCHGALYSLLYHPACQRPAPSPPNSREREEEGGSERPGFIKADGTARPARPRRPDL